MNLIIGTSGYDYPEWKGNFYPENIKRSDFLSFYATIFNGLELNNTFYNMPDASRMENFVSKTEEKVIFSVKANRLLTHEVDGAWESSAETFKKSLLPMQKKALLGAVLFQFPQSFRYTDRNRLYLADLIKNFEGFPVVIEFRHREWIKASVFEGLVQRNASVAFCDMPQLRSLPDGKSLGDSQKLYSQFIGPEAYIRLHGRNAESWYAASPENNGSGRYNYDYSEDELRSFLPGIHVASEEGRKVQVYFNNHPQGHGAKNARSLMEMIRVG